MSDHQAILPPKLRRRLTNIFCNGGHEELCSTFFILLWISIKQSSFPTSLNPKTNRRSNNCYVFRYGLCVKSKFMWKGFFVCNNCASLTATPLHKSKRSHHSVILLRSLWAKPVWMVNRLRVQLIPSLPEWSWGSSSAVNVNKTIWTICKKIVHILISICFGFWCQSIKMSSQKLNLKRININSSQV